MPHTQNKKDIEIISGIEGTIKNLAGWGSMVSGYAGWSKLTDKYQTEAWHRGLGDDLICDYGFSLPGTPQAQFVVEEDCSHQITHISTILSGSQPGQQIVGYTYFNNKKYLY